jgi:DNA repair exonuclease SbcCD ATPase subunit
LEGFRLRIQRLAATFGRLQNQTLELSDGLNILKAPNETGKSTWCAFLAAMFYGIRSRERDKIGYIADKNRYAPWSGAAMQGRLDCRAPIFGEITLLRETKSARSPMGEFRAFRAGTGDAVPGLTGDTCGETLLGIPREVFERSVFIRQGGLGITQDAELERRIVSLITSGEEDTSYSEAAAALRRQLNLRRHNKTGRIPALEAELAGIRQKLDALAGQQADLTEVMRRAESLQTRQTELEAGLARFDRYAAAQKQEVLLAAEEAAEKAEQTAAGIRQRLTADRVPGNEDIARLRAAIVNLETVRRNVDKARATRDEAMKALLRAEAAAGDSPFTGRSAESTQKTVAAVPPVRRKAWWLPLLLLVIGAGGTFLFSGGTYPLWAIAIMGCAGFFGGLLAVFLRTGSDRKKRDAYLASYGAESPEALSALADSYLKLLEARDNAQADVQARSATADALYAALSSNEQAILLEVRRFAPSAFDIPAADSLLRSCAVRRRECSDAEIAAREARVRYEVLSQQTPAPSPEENGRSSMAPPEGSRAELSEQLQKTVSDLSALRSRADRLSGQIAAVGDGAELTARAEQLETQLQTLSLEYDSIALAMETLEAANAALQTRFSPALGRRTAEIFSELTGGRYQGVLLDRTFTRLSAEPSGDSIYRDAQLLSAGAADQLYLAVRLAVCELVLPSEKAVPMILDDALANFDDARCESALRWLRREAEHRQILLFTCHTREAAFFRDDASVSIQELTNPSVRV